MDPEDAIASVLAANTTLMLALPGGVYSYKTTGLQGISRTTTPAAYGEDGYLQPSGMVKVRSAEGNWGGLDGNEGATGNNSTFEVYLYDQFSWDALVPAANLVYSILQRQPISTYGRARYLNFLKERDPSLGEAPFYRLDFDLPGLIGDQS